MIEWLFFTAGVVSSLVLQAGRNGFEQYIQRCCVAQFIVNKRFKEGNIRTLTPPPNNTTPHVAFENCVIQKMNSVEGGLFIVGGAKGCGKSVGVAGAVEEFRALYPDKPVFIAHGAAIFQNQNLHRILGVPKGHLLSRYAPQGSVIVVDQVDCTPHELTSEMKMYMTHLADDSTNSAVFRIIVVVSNPDVFRTCLLMSDGENITDVCSPLHLKQKVPPKMIRDFVEENFPDWSDNHKNVLFRTLKSSCTFVTMAHLKAFVASDHNPLPPSAVIAKADRLGERAKLRWNRYEEVCKDLILEAVYGPPYTELSWKE